MCKMLTRAVYKCPEMSTNTRRHETHTHTQHNTPTITSTLSFSVPLSLSHSFPVLYKHANLSKF